MGLRVLIYQIPFFTLSLAMAHLTRENPTSAFRLLRWTLVATSVQAVLVIVFRVLPQIKLAYLGSAIADLFESANRIADVGNVEQSILDGSKSAGITTYANPAAAWLGLAAMASWYVARLVKSHVLKYVAALDFLAVFFTGSKAGILTAGVMVAVTIGIEMLQQIVDRRKLDIRYPMAICLALGLAGLSVPLLVEHIGNFLSDSSYTLSTRQELWWFAEDEFRAHPIFGLGFGGWEHIVPIQGREMHMPPHNAFIILWAQSGLIASLLGLGFVVTVLWWSAGRIFQGNWSEQLIAKAVFTGYLWVFIQAQGENFGLFGEEHMRPILALAMGMLAGLASKRAEELRAKVPDAPYSATLDPAASLR
jgi:O-antigen ligase